MDTQGVFDTKTTSKNCAVIFGLSTLLSSVQIYNLSAQIQENDLQHLHLFTEYGKLALDSNSGDIPFQQLLFLIRDWEFLESFECGAVGGNRMITQYLETSEKQNKEMKDIRTHLKECYSSIECFLMPHPGINILKNKDFDGKLEDISEEFKKYLDILARMVLSPKRLIVKEINGEKVRFKELAQYFKTYLQILTESGPQDPKRLLEANAEGNHINIVSACEQQYMGEMDRICNNSSFCSAEDFLKNHESIKCKVIERVSLDGRTNRQF